MRKTKIVCTLGPATDKEGILQQRSEEHTSELQSHSAVSRTWNGCGTL